MRAKVVEKELRDLKVAHELLLQAFEQVKGHMTRFAVAQPSDV